MSETAHDAPPRAVARAIGERLREARRSVGLSLAGVERESGGRFKAVVVGSYERGDRAISVARLLDLADLYRLPAVELLPAAERADPLVAARRYVFLAADLLTEVVAEPGRRPFVDGFQPAAPVEPPAGTVPAGGVQL